MSSDRTSESLTAVATLEDADATPQKQEEVLPEDLLTLQQEFSEQFTCLQEEVRSDLSGAHLKVDLKLRAYGELLLARHQTLLEKLMESRGLAPITLPDGRHEVARYDRPINLANKFPSQPHPEEVAPCLLDTNDLQATRTLHSARCPDQDNHIALTEQLEESARTSLPGTTDDLMSKRSLSARILEKVSDESNEDDPTTKKERYEQFLQGSSNDRASYTRLSESNQLGLSERLSQLRLSDRKDAWLQQRSPDPNGKDELVIQTCKPASGTDRFQERKLTFSPDKNCEDDQTRGAAGRENVDDDLQNSMPPIGYYWTEKSMNGPDSRLGRIEQSRWFDLVCATVLVSNAAFIGIQFEVQADSDSPFVFFTVCDVLFTLLFATELVVRMGAAGSLFAYFTKPGDWTWNWFDFIVTAIAIVETLLSLAGNEGLANLRAVRVLRVLRILRVVRIIRVMRFFRSLRLLISAILGTMKTGVWTAMLLIMIIYLFALVFAQAARDHLENLPSETAMTDTQIANSQVMRKYYGSLPRSVFTLWMTIVGGIDWEPAAEVLSDVSPVYVAVFVFYVGLLYLAVLNVVAGLFLQTAVEQAVNDLNDVAHEVRAQRHWYIGVIKDVFLRFDESADGAISINEFNDVMHDEKMRDFLDLLGLQITDAWTLFKLLDSNGDNGVDANEFVDGCLRLRGNARSLDIAQLIYESKNTRDKLYEIHDYLISCFEEHGPPESKKKLNLKKHSGTSSLMPAALARDVF